jgi:hypothetical protein
MIVSMGLALPAWAGTQSYSAYALKEGRFSCQIPKGWSQRREAGLEQKEKAYGVFLTGPRSEDGASTQIELRYYARGNTVFPKAEDFLKANLAPSVIPKKGEKPPVVEKTKVAGLPAKRFTRKSFQYIPPSSMDTKEIPISEEIVLVEAKEGFYTLSYAAPQSLDAKQRPVFQKVLQSFRPAQ